MYHISKGMMLSRPYCYQIDTSFNGHLQYIMFQMAFEWMTDSKINQVSNDYLWEKRRGRGLKKKERKRI